MPLCRRPILFIFCRLKINHTSPWELCFYSWGQCNTTVHTSPFLARYTNLFRRKISAPFACKVPTSPPHPLPQSKYSLIWPVGAKQNNPSSFVRGGNCVGEGIYKALPLTFFSCTIRTTACLVIIVNVSVPKPLTVFIFYFNLVACTGNWGETT